MLFNLRIYSRKKNRFFVDREKLVRRAVDTNSTARVKSCRSLLGSGLLFKDGKIVPEKINSSSWSHEMKVDLARVDAERSGERSAARNFSKETRSNWQRQRG